MMFAKSLESSQLKIFKLASFKISNPDSVGVKDANIKNVPQKYILIS